MTLAPDERTMLRKFLVERFSMDDLDVLAFDLGISRDSLPRDTSLQYAIALIEYCERRELLRDLLTHTLRERHDAGLARTACGILASA